MCLKTGCPRLVITQIISQLLSLGNNNLKFSIEVSYIYSTYSSILYCMAYCMYFISRRKIFCYILFYLISGQAFIIAAASSVTDSVCMPRFWLFLGQCSRWQKNTADYYFFRVRLVLGQYNSLVSFFLMF